jgi:hypothetical protein
VAPKSCFQRCELLSILSSLLRHKVTTASHLKVQDCARNLKNLAQTFKFTINIGAKDKNNPINKSKRLKEIARFGRAILTAADRLSHNGCQQNSNGSTVISSPQLVKEFMVDAIDRFIAASCSPSPALERSLLELSRWGSRVNNNNNNKGSSQDRSGGSSNKKVSKKKKRDGLASDIEGSNIKKGRVNSVDSESPQKRLKSRKIDNKKTTKKSRKKKRRSS